MIACPNCSRPNADDARFCQGCGHALGDRVGVEERRHVTALFADLVASTSLSDRLDPEVVRGVVGGFFERATEEIRRHGGSVEKFSGDAVMALFGLQQAHEDDPERAVRAAFAIREALAELAPEAAERHQIALAVRIGIEAGEVVVGDPFGGATMATGDALNLAARLEQHAAPGEIMVGATVHAATSRAIAYESAGDQSVHGKAEPIATWRAIRPVAEVGNARGIEGHEAPLTGRDEEVALLRDAARRAASESKAILFTVLGLPGVGKSRLIRELSGELVADGWRAVRGRCLPYGEGITYWPIGEIVRDLAGIDADLSQTDALARLRAIAPDAETAERLAFAIGLTSEAPVSGEALDREIGFAVRRLLESVAASQPMLLVVEDIHWAEPPLLDLLEYVATWTREFPILIVCLARPDLLDSRPSWGSGRMESSRLQLEPLSREEAASMVQALLHVEGLPPALREQVLDRAEGNPLFVEETVRMLIERGAVVEQDGRWLAAASITDVEVPDTIEALVRARLDALPRSERTVIQGASVIGRTFQRSAVATLVDEPVERHLEQAVLRDIVSEEPAADPSYRFKHIVIRDVAYATLPKTRRADLHLRTVEWLVGWAGDRRDEFIEIEAYHLEQAARLRREMDGGVDPDLLGTAVAALRRSAEKALARADNRSRIAFAERALALEPPADEARLEIETLLAEGYSRRGDTPRAAEMGRRIADTAEAVGRQDLHGRGLLLVGYGVWIGRGEQSDKTEAIALLREAADDLEAAGDLVHQADALYFLGMEGWWDGDLAKAREIWDRGAEVAHRSGSAGREVGFLLQLSRLEDVQGRQQQAAAYIARAAELAAETSRLTQSQVWRLQGAYLFEAGGDRADAIRLMTDSLVVAEESDDFTSRYYALHRLGELALVVGDLEMASARFREAVDLVEAADHIGWLPEAHRHLAQVLVEQGDLSGAERHALRGVATVAPDDVFSVASTKMALGMLRDAQGRADEAGELLIEALHVARTSNYTSNVTEMLLALGVHQIANGQTAAGEATTTEARQIFSSCYGPRTPFLAYADRLAAAARARAAAR